VSYIEELKIATINNDLSKMEELSEIVFESENKEELQIASAIIAEAIKLLDKERTKILDSMQNIQKMKQYAIQNSNKELL